MAPVEIWKIPLRQPATERADSHAALRVISAARPGAALSLSHTDGLALVATSSEPVGVDVESLGNAPSCSQELADLIMLTLSPRERLHVLAAGRQAAVRWLALWTRKEAFLKARGEALTSSAICDIDAFARGVRELKLGPGFVGAVAAAEETSPILHKNYADA